MNRPNATHAPRPYPLPARVERAPSDSEAGEGEPER